MKKKVLLLSPFFYPEEISTGKYNSDLAVELTKSEEVSVFCSHPLYPLWKPKFTDKNLPGIFTKRGGLKVPYPSSTILRRFTLETWFLYFCIKNIFLSREKYDLIVSVYPPNLFFVAVSLFSSKSTKRIGIIHDFQSVLMDSKKGVFRYIIRSLIRLLEKKSFSSCDKLIFLSNEMKHIAHDYYGIELANTVVCYPFITINSFQNNNYLDDIIREDTLNVVYSGALGEKQSPIELAEFLDELSKRYPEILVYIFSRGTVFDDIKKKYAKTSIRFHDLVPEHALPELLLKSTVQVIPQAIQASHGAFPSKLPNILSSGAKVFSVTAESSEVAKILNNYSRSLVTDSWQQPGLYESVADFVECKILQPEEDRALIEQFSLGHLAKTILA